MTDENANKIPPLERTPNRLASYGSQLREVVYEKQNLQKYIAVKGVNRMLGTLDQFLSGQNDEESGTCSAGDQEECEIIYKIKLELSIL